MAFCLYFCPTHRNTSKKYNIMAFNAGNRVNCSTWTQVLFSFCSYNTLAMNAWIVLFFSVLIEYLSLIPSLKRSARLLNVHLSTLCCHQTRARCVLIQVKTPHTTNPAGTLCSCCCYIPLKSLNLSLSLSLFLNLSLTLETSYQANCYQSSYMKFFTYTEITLTATELKLG